MPIQLWTRTACCTLFAAAGVLACAAAEVDMPTSPQEPAATEPQQALINDYIQSLSPLAWEDPERVESAPSAPVDSGDYRCVERTIEETRAYDEIVAYAANSGALWPGAIIRGDSVYSGQFTQLVFDRNPLTVSVSLENLTGSPSGTMAAPSLSDFRDTIGEVLSAEVNGATAARVFAEIEEVRSQEQLALALGAETSWPGDVARISAAFSFNDESVRSRHLVRFVQAYYTVDIDQPRQPSDFFADNVTLEQVEASIFDGNPPVYVSSITYGRLVVFSIESEYSSEETEAALQFAYQGGTAVSGDVSLTHQEMLSSTKITAYIVGGSGAEAVQAINGFEDLMAFIGSGGNYSPESPGAPIAYQLNHLSDNSPARLSFTDSYTVEDCERVSQSLRVRLTGIKVTSAGGDPQDNLEIFGKISAVGSESVTLFDKTDLEYVVIAEDSTYPDSGFLGEAILAVVPKPGEAIDLEAVLNDYDTLSPNDVLCDDSVSAAFETGWRRDVEIFCTGDEATVSVLVRLDPI